MAGSRGGKRPGAGRPKGSGQRIPPWKGDPTYKGLEALAQEASPEAMQTIIWLSQNADNPNCRLAACNTILDRAWGKARQSHKHQHSVEQRDRPITDIEFVGQVDLRRLTDDELRDFQRLLDRATVPPPIEAQVTPTPALGPAVTHYGPRASRANGPSARGR
jgi:hypothetical protein